ncbi:ATP-dependent DNA helicase Rep [subsurface metagenome]|jgi:superfamily I DNA/RNA helicase
MTRKLRIFGPPGTGKTTELLGFVEGELVSGVRPEEIVYTSFTRAAAREARDRALTKFMSYHPDDFMWFSTIHSICFHLLGLSKDSVFAGKKLAEFCNIYGYEVSSDSKDEAFEHELHQRVLETEADYFEHFINWQRNLMLDFNTAYDIFTRRMDVPKGFNDERLKVYISRRNEYKAENNLWDFCDMIDVVISERLCPSGIKVMVSDEFQDLTPLLAKVTDLWSQSVERYYFAGDPYQAIYTWMGADPSIFINAKADRTLVLKQTYRCPVAVHDLSRVIVNRFNTRYQDDDYIPKNEPGEILRSVPEIIDWDKLGKKVFYLHRTHWLLSQAFNDLLLDGIPFATVKGRMSPLQTPKANVVSSAFKLLNLKYVPISDVARMMDYLPSKTVREIYLKQGAKAECRRMVEQKPHRSVSYRDLPNLGFTNDFLAYFKPESILHPFKLSIDEKAYFIRIIQKYGTSVLEGEPKVILSTLHGVKGRECDTSIINLNLTRKTYDGLMTNPDDEHRLFYVGVTRSRDKVILLEPEDYQSYRL